MHKALPGDVFKICLHNHDAAATTTVLYSTNIEYGESTLKSVSLASRKISKIVSRIDFINAYIERQHAANIQTASQVLRKLYISCFLRILIHVSIGLALNKIFKKMFEVKSFI